MTNPLNNLKREAEHIRLSAAEKNAMRARLFGAPAPAPVGSPYFFFNWQFMQTRVLAPLAVVLLVGSGTAYAAEGALPGEVLYPVKIYVNESVKVSLATTPAKEAEVHATLAERRVVEAQELAAEGRLDATTTEALALDIEKHVAVAEAKADEAEETDKGKGRELKARLAATLETGGAILVELGNGTDEGSKQNAGNLAVRAIARADGAANTRTFAKAEAEVDAFAPATALMVADSSGVEGMPEVAADPAEQEAAAELQLKAADALKEAREAYAEVAALLKTRTATWVDKEFSSIEISMSLGAATLGTGDSAGAEQHFTEALRASVRLTKLLEAYQKYNGNRLAPLLGGGDTEPAAGEVEGAETETAEPSKEDDHSGDEDGLHGIVPVKVLR